jgi:hypothetical protein
MARDARLSFYADMKRVDIPQASLSGIIAAARSGGARYLVADGTLFQIRPQMETFLNPLLVPSLRGLVTFSDDGYQPVPGFRLVLLYKDPSSAGVAVYKISE